MIKLENVSFRYRKGSDALNDVTTVINPGIHLLLGENGAGKTTLLHLIDGILRPQSGECLIDGINSGAREPGLMRRCFFLSDSFDCPFRTIESMARCHAIFYPGFSAERLHSNLEAFGLTGRERLKRLSLGMRHKAYVAYALSLGVDYLFLDEPANGLDIDSKKELRKMIGLCTGDDQTVIISTHTVYDLQSLFDGVVVLSHGRLLISMPSWQVTERLAFVASTSPVDDALYQEPDSGVFRAIITNEGGLQTDVNYALLYSALMSDKSDAIISILKENDQ